MRQGFCQASAGGAYMCLGSESSASALSDISDLTQPMVVFGPQRLADLQIGFTRNAQNNTCSPWPLAQLDGNGIILKGLAIALAGAVLACMELTHICVLVCIGGECTWLACTQEEEALHHRATRVFSGIVSLPYVKRTAKLGHPEHWHTVCTCA